MPDDLHALALKAALAGANAIRTISRSHLAPRDKGGFEDLITVADLASERAIIETIRNERPEDHIVAEESGRHPGSSDVCWYVDPLDGTANFVAGSYDYAVSIAAYRNEKPAAATIYRPADDQWLATTTGGRLHETLTQRLSSAAPITDLHITVSRPHDPMRLKEAKGLREMLLPHVNEERRVGSAACALLLVATGKLDAYISVDLPRWDVAAGHLLVELAGGVVLTTFLATGTAVSVAASPSIARSLISVLDHASTEMSATTDSGAHSDLN